MLLFTVVKTADGISGLRERSGSEKYRKAQLLWMKEDIIVKAAKNYKFWFATGSQDLYGDECLRKVAEHSRIIVD